MVTEHPAGVVAPLVTPIGTSGEVSAEGIRLQIASIHRWVDGLMPAISCGEGWRLTTGQWTTTISTSVAASRGLPVYAGCQARTWDEMKTRAMAAGRMGADAAVVSVPAASQHLSDTALLRAFAELKDMLQIPVIYYWESFVSHRDVQPLLCSQICDTLEAIAVKDSMHQPESTLALIGHRAGRTTVLQGWEDLLHADLGVDGFVGPLALLSDVPRSVLAGCPRWDDIRELTERYGLLESDYVARVKAELYRRGVIPTAAEFQDDPDAV
jgi:4-hydroxy-tetrahydrodipicolinate synthase